VTAQAPDEFVNLHADFDLAGLSLFGVIQGDPAANHGWGSNHYQHERQPKSLDPGATCFGKGHLARYCLHPDGRLTLAGYQYPMTGVPPERVDEPLHGDFWLVLKRDFYSDRTYVPFREGKLVTDRAQWRQEQPKRWSPAPDDPFRMT
jgi:hypothetical protein